MSDLRLLIGNPPLRMLEKTFAFSTHSNCCKKCCLSKTKHRWKSIMAGTWNKQAAQPKRSFSHQRTMTLTLLLVLIVAPPIGVYGDAGASIDVSGSTAPTSIIEDEIYQPECRAALGMHSQDILDHHISASSAYDMKSVGPHNSRIRTEVNGGAWCPKELISKDIYEWLQVDFQKLKVVTQVETQGRFGNGQGQEYATHYLLEYQREDMGRWRRFRDRRGQEIFLGNSNTYIPEMREVRPPIIARRLRFIPYSVHRRTVCMRVEVYGCDWKDDTVTYSMRQGDRRGAEVDFYDFTYDGVVVDGQLSGGLGQLTDHEEGITNFRLDAQSLGKKGYEWVGWKNDSTTAKTPVLINFEFDHVRNFSAIRIHCNNQFTKDVRVFSAAKVYFGNSRGVYTGEPVLYKYFRDNLMEFARYVTIPLPHRIGKYVKLELHFDSRWIMLSELRFDSVLAVGSYSDQSLMDSVAEASGEGVGVGRAGPVPRHRHKNPRDPNDPNLKHRGPHVLEVDLMHEADTHQGASESDSSTEPSDLLQDTSHPPKDMDEAYIGVIIGALIALILLLLVIVIIIYLRQRKLKYASNPLKVKQQVFGTDHVNFNLNDLTNGLSNGKVSNGNMYNPVSTNELENGKLAGSMQKVNTSGEVYREENIQKRKLPEPPPKTPEGSTDTMVSGPYANPDTLNSQHPGSLVVNLPSTPVFNNSTDEENARHYTHHNDSPPPPPPLPHAHAMSAAVDHVNIQGLSGSSVYSAPNIDLLWTEDFSVIEFPRETLKFVEKLGEGQFGEVHLCEALNVAEILGTDFLVNRTTGARTMMVAVKTLRPDASEHARADFHKEVKIMSRLKDTNVVRVLGVCTQEEPLAVVVEYMKYGDLHQFMLQHSPEGSNAPGNPLSYGALIYMGTQIASGMKYLESLNMIHRDLATRNCLVGHAYTIKVSDFGMSRSLYSSDYYRIEGKAVLPIRWMAWESVLLGKFSCKSDVWSFAVTMWEILTFAREQPFDELTDEQVIDNCGHYYRHDNQEVYLPPPSICPKEIFDLLLECWNRDEAQRPTFREIHMFLQRKNMGYRPY